MIHELKKLPNQATLLRLVLIPVLWVLAILHLNVIFAAVIFVAGLTDVADGFLARKLKQVSPFGTWFDSMVDNILSFSLIFWLWFLIPEFLWQNISLLLVVFLLFLFSLGIGYLKYGKMIEYHLYTGKTAAVMLYAFSIHATFFQPNQLLFYLASIVIIIAMLEEMIVTLTHKRMIKDKLSIFR